MHSCAYDVRTTWYSTMNFEATISQMCVNNGFVPLGKFCAGKVDLFLPLYYCFFLLKRASKFFSVFKRKEIFLLHALKEQELVMTIMLIQKNKFSTSY